METNFKEVWRIEASVVALCCGIVAVSGWIGGFVLQQADANRRHKQQKPR